MNSRIIFFGLRWHDPVGPEFGNSSSSSISIFRSSIFVIAFRNEPLILRNGISLMLKSSSVRLCWFRISCSISPNLPCENLVLYPARIPVCWPFCSRFRFSFRAWVIMSLKILDWTAWMYIKSIFFGRCFNAAVGTRWLVVGRPLSSWISWIAFWKFLFRIALPILILD